MHQQFSASLAPEKLIWLEIQACNARFSGPEFPPLIVFKIFHLKAGQQYISGRRVFQPSNQATIDACRMMGNRKFMNYIIADEIQRQGRVVADTCDVTCMRDFMQYSSHLDELPAHLGGRENSWRSLSLPGLSRDNRNWNFLRMGGKYPVANKLKPEQMLLDTNVFHTLFKGALPSRALRSPAVGSFMGSLMGSTAHRAPTPANSYISQPSTRHSARAGATAARMRHLYMSGGTQKDDNTEVTRDIFNSKRTEPRNKQEKGIGGSDVRSVESQRAVPLEKDYIRFQTSAFSYDFRAVTLGKSDGLEIESRREANPYYTIRDK
ncbi:hypothetical protein DPEC_G00240070 [Dallia pectoralis]|uniref:Uncharacterized protein n=1 Tax=Dallia pectoralis TaxID=75939 RepID=A0ACC2FZE1_DALPE|nr:hypothetical protein DPEC_G00240070 [Dallia pectoralis]